MSVGVIADKDAVDVFVKSLGTPERAQFILGPRVNSLLGAEITKMAMADLVSTDPGKEAGQTKVDDKMNDLHALLMKELKGPLRSDYGIELVDIRLRRFNHPEKVREAIFERIKSERAKKAAEIESAGDLQAKNIASAADEKARNLLAQANFEEAQLKGKSDAEAMDIRNQAHRQDPEFYAFLKKMEKLQSILGDNKTVLLLSTNRPLFELLFQPPVPRKDASVPPQKKEGPK